MRMPAPPVSGIPLATRSVSGTRFNDDEPYQGASIVTSEPQSTDYEILSGIPPQVPMQVNETVLFDTTCETATLPDEITLTGCCFSISTMNSRPPVLRQLTAEHDLMVAVYIDDSLAPRATMGLHDLLRGAFQFSICCTHGVQVRVVLIGNSIFTRSQRRLFVVALQWSWRPRSKLLAHSTASVTWALSCVTSYAIVVHRTTATELAHL
ncbi:MAG: hypothetical protein R2867_45925 [Caldilineaceae bacterium]